MVNNDLVGGFYLPLWKMMEWRRMTSHIYEMENNTNLKYDTCVFVHVFCLNNCKITLELRKPSQMIRLSNKMCVTNIGIWFNQNWSLTNNHDKHGHLKPSQTNHINQNNISWWFVDPCLFCWTLREICGVLLTKLSELGPDLPTSDSSGGTVCELENGPVASLIYHGLPIKSGDFQ